jgi:hypothetical protein
MVFPWYPIGNKESRDELESPLMERVFGMALAVVPVIASPDNLICGLLVPGLR